jgi:hypothetical protein
MKKKEITFVGLQLALRVKILPYKYTLSVGILLLRNLFQFYSLYCIVPTLFSEFPILYLWIVWTAGQTFATWRSFRPKLSAYQKVTTT